MSCARGLSPLGVAMARGFKSVGAVLDSYKHLVELVSASEAAHDLQIREAGRDLS